MGGSRRRGGVLVGGSFPPSPVIGNAITLNWKAITLNGNAEVGWWPTFFVGLQASGVDFIEKQLFWLRKVPQKISFDGVGIFVKKEPCFYENKPSKALLENTAEGFEKERKCCWSWCLKFEVDLLSFQCLVKSDVTKLVTMSSYGLWHPPGNA